MYDQQTNSKWVHASGLAMKGPLAGKRLRFLGSRVMRWKDWKRQYPNTKVLAKRGRQGFMGNYIANESASELGLSIGQGPRSTLYSFQTLLEKKVINDEVNKRSVVVTIDPSNKSTAAFSRKIDGMRLTFEPMESSSKSLMQDKQTGSIWNRLSGESIKGELKGKKLRSIMAVPWKISRWRDIYRKGRIYEK